VSGRDRKSSLPSWWVDPRCISTSKSRQGGVYQPRRAKTSLRHQSQIDSSLCMELPLSCHGGSFRFIERASGGERSKEDRKSSLPSRWVDPRCIRTGKSRLEGSTGLGEQEQAYAADHSQTPFTRWAAIEVHSGSFGGGSGKDGIKRGAYLHGGLIQGAYVQ